MKILNINGMSAGEKLYYSYIYSFGGRGCWATDEQIAKALGEGPKTIQRHKATCVKMGLLVIECPGSPRRRIWAKDHPKYKIQPGHICPSTRTKVSRLPGQKCPTTIKDTIKTTKGEKIERFALQKTCSHSIEQLKRNFGRGACRASTLSAAEGEQRRQEQKRVLGY